jgi:hypothetical protein
MARNFNPKTSGLGLPSTTIRPANPIAPAAIARPATLPFRGEIALTNRPASG